VQGGSEDKSCHKEKEGSSRERLIFHPQAMTDADDRMISDRPVYEVTLSIDRAVLDEFDAWLEQHVHEMLKLPGFISAETFETETDSPDKAGRTVLCVLESEDALQAYLSGPAEEMRLIGTLRFKDQ